MFYFYVASSLKNVTQVQELIEFAEQNTEWFCLYDWTTHVMSDNTDPETRKEALTNELDAIVASHLVIALPPLSRGSHVELGYALAHNTPIIMVGERDYSCLSYDLMGWMPDMQSVMEYLAK